MGIIGAVFTPDRSDVRRRIVALSPAVRIVADGPTFVLAAFPGATVTVHTEPGGGQDASDEKAPAAALDGSPMLYDGHSYSRPGDLALRVASVMGREELVRRLAGQYVLARSDGGGLAALTDSAGMRSLFVYREIGLALFASRLERITSVVPGLRLDFESFGSHWMAHNQLSERFFVTGVRRLTRGAGLRVWIDETGRVREEISPAPKGPISEDAARDRAMAGIEGDDLFAPVERFFSRHDGPIGLALSGGMDSRLLLALAIRGSARDLRPFVYDAPGSSDADVAEKVAAAVGVSCERFAPISLRSLIESGMLERYARDSMIHTPLSACRRLSHYETQFSETPGMVLVDGALGEIGRAQFFRRLEMIRRLGAYRRISRTTFEDGLYRLRADVFSDEASAVMRDGFRHDVRELERFLATSTLDRPEDWAGVLYKGVNFFGHSQAWIDRFGFNFMPLGQAQTIAGYFALPLILRRGGRLFRRVIRRAAPVLSRLPLAKGGSVYPFFLPGALTPVYLSLAARRNGRGHAPSPWASEPDFVLDMLTSGETRSWSGYDRVRLDALEAQFRQGRYAEIDWFLAFELWRRAHAIT